MSSDRNDDKKRKRSSSRVPTSRAERLARIGWMTGELALGGAAEGVRRLVGGGSDDDNPFFNSAGAERLARRLSRMRGAAMKIGQMISLLDDEILPKEFAEALAILRDSADTMPESQVRDRLHSEYGRDWSRHFEDFDFEPIASASIGQVHTATLRDGRKVALKIQYPGVAESIDSDVRNLAMALKAARILPRGFEIDDIIEESKRQLQQEADYVAESEYLEGYREQLEGDSRYRVPARIEELTTPRILAMERLYGLPLEDLASPEHDQALRDETGARLFELLFRELFDFGLMQTDPNFGNYLLLGDPGRPIGLLDFGSSSEVPESLVASYRKLFVAIRDEDRAGVEEAARNIGFILDDDSEAIRNGLVSLFLLVFEPFSYDGAFDFEHAGIMKRAQAHAMELAFKHGYMRTPPAQTMFLHRKLDGTLMLCGRIKARVNVREILDRVLAD